MKQKIISVGKYQNKKGENYKNLLQSPKRIVSLR
jgi:hypothetical protein